MTEIRQNFTAKVRENTGLDPRIDSPNVKVIYPSPVEEQIPTDIQMGKADTIPTETVSEVKEQPVEKKEEHKCKVDIQEAVKQNLLGFSMIVILALGIGYLIGKK